jgi:hypothetical protein
MPPGMTSERREDPQPEPAPGLSHVVSTVIGWLGAALITAVVFGFVRADAHAKLRLGSRALLHLYDFGQSLVIGIAIVAVAAALSLWRRRPKLLGWGLAFVAAAAAGVVWLDEDLTGLASRLSGGRDSALPLYAVCAVAAQLVPLGALVARRLARGIWRWGPVALAAGLAVANHFVLPGDYPGMHLLCGALAATIASSALLGLPWRPPVLLIRVLTGVAALAAGFAAFVPPPNAVGVRLRYTWSATLSASLPRVFFGRRGVGGGQQAAPVEKQPSIPPSQPPLLHEDAIVLYLSIDSLRADVMDDSYADQLPSFHALRDQSTWFTVARSPGTQTAVTLTAVMTGTYFSQQYWTKKHVPEGGGVSALFAHQDRTVRFPTILAAAGIPTVQYAQAVWLLNEYGMTRGFSEERFIEPKAGKSTKGKWSTGNDILAAIEGRLRKHAGGPLFLFFHDLDPHAPFDLGEKKSGTIKKKWLSEVQLSDTRLGRLRKVLAETGLERRTVIILSADHGEAFSEHGTNFHGQNLYEEQVRVPLVIHVPGGQARRIDEPVTLVDLGPTVLDLLRQPTPGHFMGQSLVPYLRGDKPTLTRPIIAETRLKQSMVLPSGIKLIRDLREQTFEIYDLNADPNELDNLYDDMGPDGDALMKKLEEFFAAHRIQRAGYTIPFRR